MRILVDYRPALRARTGVGEYIHTLVRAYTSTHDDAVTLFTSSWKDRPSPSEDSELRARVVDLRVPVSVLNYMWHRVEWPAVETLAGDADVVHAAHTLLIPTRHAAQIVTIHDLFFLLTPQRTRAEIRRDYAELSSSHARRAEAVITSSAHTKRLVIEHLGVEADKVTEDASFIDDLGADSLDIVELVMAFEEEFGVEIPDDAAEKIGTVKDAIDYIDSKQ